MNCIVLGHFKQIINAPHRMHCNDMRMMRSWFSYSLKEEHFASFSVDPSPQIVLMRSD